MGDMPRPRPPHLQREENRHGNTVWYVRIGKGPRIRIKAALGSPEFEDAYQAALRGERPAKAGTAAAGSLEWLITRYRDSSDWAGLSLATRRQRENILKQVIASAGRQPFAQITEATIAAGRDRRSKTPFQARHFLDTMRGLCGWAHGAKYITTNPAAGVKYPRLATVGGFPVWTEEDVIAYEARWPIGTRQRVWMAVLLYTGLRRGDAVRLGRQHVRNGIATIKTDKSKHQIEVALPILPVLAEVLAAGPTADLAFICGADGKPFKKESFGNAFSEACRSAGVRKSAHGLRKIGATRAAMNGANVHQLNALFGWTGNKMASLYTQSADRARLARESINKLTVPPQDEVVSQFE